MEHTQQLLSDKKNIGLSEGGVSYYYASSSEGFDFRRAAAAAPEPDWVVFFGDAESECVERVSIRSLRHPLAPTD